MAPLPCDRHAVSSLPGCQVTASELLQLSICNSRPFAFAHGLLSCAFSASGSFAIVARFSCASLAPLLSTLPVRFIPHCGRSPPRSLGCRLAASPIPCCAGTGWARSPSPSGLAPCMAPSLAPAIEDPSSTGTAPRSRAETAPRQNFRFSGISHLPRAQKAGKIVSANSAFCIEEGSYVSGCH